MRFPRLRSRINPFTPSEQRVNLGVGWLSKRVTMRLLCRFFIGLASLAPILLLVSFRLAAQNPPQAREIRVSTHLVQIGIIVRDKHAPVANLTKDDFEVFDRGKPQKISVFSIESGISVEPVRPAPQPAPAHSLPQNIFSDLPQDDATIPRSVTIVLLDSLNALSGNGHDTLESGSMWMEDLALANAKAHLIEFVKTLDPRDRVAIYGLSDTLHVLSDFTSDRDRLLTVLKNYDMTSRTNREAAEPGKQYSPAGPEFDAAVNAQALDLAAAINQNRAVETMAALHSIAAHVTSIPGRKNLVWLTANLPFSGASVVRILVPARIAAYPMDARGLLPRAVPDSVNDVGGGVALLHALQLGDSSPAQSDQPIGVDTMQKMAEETGGRAFVNTNDLTGAIRDAVEDSAVTYTLGFYINVDSLDGKFHELRVKVNRSGLNIRYPKGYFALKDTAASQDERHNQYLVAIRSPLESSSIPVTIKAIRVEKPLPHCLSLVGSIDIRKLRFTQSAGAHKGAVEIATIEQDETGKILRQSASKINFDFSESKYSAYLKTGFPFHQFVQPQAGVTTLRIVVQDPSTAEVGSLIIPLSRIN